MWLKLKTWRRDERGMAVPQYLVLALILGGVAIAVAAALTPALRGVHNAAVDSITAITGSGF